MGKIVKPDKEEVKKDFAQLKSDFVAGIKDGKRWLYCLIEIAITGLLLAADLLLKHFVYGHCDTKGDIIIIDKVIRFTAVKNTGASFGMMKNSTALLSIISLVCSIALIFFIFYSYPRRNKWLRAALVSITAGALGNVVDRLWLGYVRDYVYFELINFAVFNFADSCLCVGVALLIIYILFYYTKEEEEAKKSKAEAALSEKINALLEEAEEEAEEASVKQEFAVETTSEESASQENAETASEENLSEASEEENKTE